MERLEFIKVAETTDIIFDGKSIGYIQEYLEETVWLEVDYNGILHKGVIKSQLVAMRNVEDYLYACDQLKSSCKNPQKF